MNIRQYGRLLFLVQSQSRRDMIHMVDVEPLDDDGRPAQFDGIARCSCEAYEFHVARPCKHILAVCDKLAVVMEFEADWKLKKPIAKPQKKQYKLNHDTNYTDTKDKRRGLHSGVHSVSA